MGHPATPSAARLDADVAGAHRTAGAWPELGHHRGPQTLQVARARGEDEIDDVVGEREGRRDPKEDDSTATSAAASNAGAWRRTERACAEESAHARRSVGGGGRPEKSSRKEEEAARERPACLQHGCKCCGEQRGHRRARRERAKKEPVERRAEAGVSSRSEEESPWSCRRPGRSTGQQKRLARGASRPYWKIVCPDRGRRPSRTRI